MSVSKDAYAMVCNKLKATVPSHGELHRKAFGNPVCDLCLVVTGTVST